MSYSNLDLHGGLRRIKSTMAIFIAATSLMLATETQAVPQGGAVIAGKATIANSAIVGCSEGTCFTYNTTAVNQTTQKAVITWKSFNVLSNSSQFDTVKFVAPNSSAITLNIINSAAPSFINGTVLGNGQLWFVNPTGFVFHGASEINAGGGLLFSTAGINNPAGSGFYTNKSGTYNFSVPGSPTATILENNASSILAGGGTPSQAGQVFFQGAAVHIDNSSIDTNNGKVVLAAVSSFDVDFNGDGLVSYELTGPVTVKVPGETSSIGVNASYIGGKDIEMNVIIDADAVLDHLINLGTGDTFTTTPHTTAVIIE